MAAMVERPMSVLNDISTPGPATEIIDVDAFEDEGLNLSMNLISQEQPSPLTRPVPGPLDRGSQRTTPQTIYLLDSDDDDFVASGSRVISNLGELPNCDRN
jgi:hypothetical protein